MARVILSRGGARFKDRVLPAAMERVRRKPADMRKWALPWCASLFSATGDVVALSRGRMSRRGITPKA